MRAGDLGPRASLAGERTSNIVWSRRQCPQLGMNFRIVIESPRETAQLSILDQTGEGLINRSTSRGVEKVGGREDTAASNGPGASHNPIGS